MGRIVAQVTVDNPFDDGKRMVFDAMVDAMVDTGAGYLTLPTAWMDRFGTFRRSEIVELQLADHSTLQGTLCGPAFIEIEGFRGIFNEVLFIDMQDTDGSYQPLIGYLPLEQSQAAVDKLGHRLVHVQYIDLKQLATKNRQLITDN